MRTTNFSKAVLLAVLMSAMSIVSKADLAINSENFPDIYFRYVIIDCIEHENISLGYESAIPVLTDEEVAKFKRVYSLSSGFFSSEGIHLLTSLEEVKMINNFEWYDKQPPTDVHLDLSQCYNLKYVKIQKNYIYYYLPDCEFEFTDCSRLFGFSSIRGIILDEDKCYDLSRFLSYEFEPDRIRNLTGAEIVGDKMKFTHRRAIYEYNCSKTDERWLKFCIFTNDLSLPENPEFPEFEIAFNSASGVPEILTDEKGRDYVVIKVAELKKNIYQGEDLLFYYNENIQQWVIKKDGLIGNYNYGGFYLNYENTLNDFCNYINNYGNYRLQMELFSYDEMLDVGYYKVYFPENDGFKYNPAKSYPISFLIRFNLPGIDRYYSISNRFNVHSNRLIIPATVSVNTIEAERQDSQVEYYTLQGIRLHQKPTIPGIYIIRNGGETKKIVVK